MHIMLTLAYLFFIGSIIGWILELLYRNLRNRNKTWINPGFCIGPYLPIYGFGLCILYLMASVERYHLIQDPFWNRLTLFLFMAVGMTMIEYIAGLFCVKFLKVRLWDYSDRIGNIQGIICPQFSALWALLGAIYYFWIHSHILDGLIWLSRNLAFSFFIGMFFGVFMIDVIHSSQLMIKLKKFAEENRVILIYEGIKEHIRNVQKDAAEKYNLFRPFQSRYPLGLLLKEVIERKEKQRKQTNRVTKSD